MGESEKTTKTTFSQLSAGEQSRSAEMPVGQEDSETQMGDENNIIDVEAEEIVDSDNLPAVIPRANSYVSDTPIEAEQGQKTADGRDWPHGPTPDRRCRAHKKTGEQCKNAAILGSTVCRFHGGAAKHVKAAARARLENAADLMAKQLLGIALTAEGEAVKLAAIRDALDRAGLKPPAEVVLSQGETKPYEELFDDIASGTRAESRRARGVPDTDDGFAGFAIGAEGVQTQPPTQGEAPDQGETSESCARREFRNSTPHPRDGDYQSASVSGQQETPSAEDGALRQPRPRETGRERGAQPPARHITGEAAIRAANEANRQIGALKAIEGPHKRYRRP
ncbi:HGGxSTG domain-containing protein [Mycobacterium sp. 1274761.0]|uniref:HGGxSTG domain-containing protein n=1 Tax=Mycobacterium sp. 1274761.0 TaxID=1834077 RepID=UPI001E2FE488|nr:HGGxSTG domain-containing protein [Mycobacterium sp. 1274761.0]